MNYFFLKALSDHCVGKTKDTMIDWKAVRGLMEDAIYGGRIDNSFDLRVLRTYLRYKFMLYIFYMLL